MRLAARCAEQRDPDHPPEAAVLARRRQACEVACMLSEGASCLHLGSDLEAEERPAAALAAFERGCRQQNARACGSASWLLRGRGRDLPRALDLAGRACSLGSIQGCAAAAGLLAVGGEGIAASPAGAAALYEKGVAAGHAESCRQLAVMLTAGLGIPVDRPRAAALWKRSAEISEAACQQVPPDPWGCVHLVWQLREGVGIAADSERASEARRHTWLPEPSPVDGRTSTVEGTQEARRRCEAGEYLGCFDLARRQSSGLGGLQADPTKASETRLRGLDLVRQECEQHAYFCYAYGDALTEQKAPARAAYERGCAFSEGRSCLGLGRLAEEQGDQEVALHHYQEACELSPYSTLAGCSAMLKLARKMGASR